MYEEIVHEQYESYKHEPTQLLFTDGTGTAIIAAEYLGKKPANFPFVRSRAFEIVHRPSFQSLVKLSRTIASPFSDLRRFLFASFAFPVRSLVLFRTGKSFSESSNCFCRSYTNSRVFCIRKTRGVRVERQRVNCFLLATIFFLPGCVSFSSAPSPSL